MTPCPHCGAEVVQKDRGAAKKYCSRDCQVKALHRGESGLMIRLDRDLHARLREAAEARDLSMRVLVTKALEDYLPRLIPVDELRLTREVA